MIDIIKFILHGMTLVLVGLLGLIILFSVWMTFTVAGVRVMVLLGWGVPC